MSRQPDSQQPHDVGAAPHQDGGPANGGSFSENGASHIAPTPGAVRQQLERILHSPEFRLGKRYPAFLKFIVDEALAGRADQLKERTVGVAVFGREPDYDTNTNHAVRSAAAEVRKRLAQYYQDDSHRAELRIEVPSGAYAPQFRAAPRIEETAPQPLLIPPFGWDRRLKRWALYVAIFAAGIAAALLLRPALSASRQTALDRFWRPVLAERGPVVLCIADDPRLVRDPNAAPTLPQIPSIGDVRALVHQVTHMEDAVTLARLSAQIHASGGDFRVLTASASSFNDLKESPAVLIGGFSNPWTRRILDGLRFRLAFTDTPSGPMPSIVDSRNPSKPWSPVPTSAGLSASDLYRGYGAVAKDYALAVRYRDSRTGQILVIAAGVLGFGALAAGEFLTSADLMQKLASRAKGGWENKNLEVVLSTEVVQGVPSPPEIVTMDVW